MLFQRVHMRTTTASGWARSVVHCFTRPQGALKETPQLADLQSRGLEILVAVAVATGQGEPRIAVVEHPCREQLDYPAARRRPNHVRQTGAVEADDATSRREHLDLVGEVKRLRNDHLVPEVAERLVNRGLLGLCAGTRQPARHVE